MRYTLESWGYLRRALIAEFPEVDTDTLYHLIVARLRYISSFSGNATNLEGFILKCPSPANQNDLIVIAYKAVGPEEWDLDYTTTERRKTPKGKSKGYVIKT